MVFVNLVYLYLSSIQHAIYHIYIYICDMIYIYTSMFAFSYIMFLHFLVFFKLITIIYT